MSDYGRAALLGGLMVIVAALGSALVSGNSSVAGFAGVGVGLLVAAVVDSVVRRRKAERDRQS